MSRSHDPFWCNQCGAAEMCPSPTPDRHSIWVALLRCWSSVPDPVRMYLSALKLKDGVHLGNKIPDGQVLRSRMGSDCAQSDEQGNVRYEALT